MSRDGKILFYELFANYITISIRGYWSDDTTDDALKVEKMKWINEIQHRVTSKIRHERLGLKGWGNKDWSEESFAKMMEGYVRKCPSIAVDVGWCINSAFEKAQRNDS